MTPAQKKLAIFAAIIATIIIVLILVVKVAKIPVFAMAMALTAKSTSTSSNSTSSSSSKKSCVTAGPLVDAKRAELVNIAIRDRDAAVKEEIQRNVDYANGLQAAMQYVVSDPNRYGILMNDVATKYAPALEAARVRTAAASNRLVEAQTSKITVCG